jgi:hypothetical protein
MNLPETIEPPLSPLPGGVAGAAPEAPNGTASPALNGPPPLTTRLLRMGLVTLPQLSAAMAQQAATGRPLEELVVELGLISAEDLAKLDESAPTAAPTAPLAPAPEPVLEVAPVPEPAPAPVYEVQPHAFQLDPTPNPTTAQPAPVATPEPVAAHPVAGTPEPLAMIAEPAPAPEPMPYPVEAPPVATYAVVVQLENGVKLDVGAYPDAQSARDAATAVMRAVRAASDDWPVLGGRFVRPEAVVAIEIATLI